MMDLLTKLDNLKRPRLLIRAARIGLAEYRRDVDLKRHVGHGPLPRSGVALAQLVELESGINEQRRAQNAGYSSVKHVDVLIAMMGEARIMRASQATFAPLRKCVR